MASQVYNVNNREDILLCVLIIFLVLKIHLEMFLFLKHYSSELLSMLPGIHRGQCGGVWPLGCWNSV